MKPILEILAKPEPTDAYEGVSEADLVPCAMRDQAPVSIFPGHTLGQAEAATRFLQLRDRDNWARECAERRRVSKYWLYEAGLLWRRLKRQDAREGVPGERFSRFCDRVANVIGFVRAARRARHRSDEYPYQWALGWVVQMEGRGD